MGTNEKNMTAGSPGKLIITFAIPLMLGNIFQQFYTMADTMIVGQVVGVEALAAVGAWRLAGLAGAGHHDRYHTGLFDSCIAVLWSRGKGKSEMCGGEKLYYDSITVCDCTCSK